MYCVIMGDIIKSAAIKKEKREQILNAAKDIFAHINFKYRSALLADFGIVRGDAFEGVLLAQHQAPKIIQEIIKGFYRAEKTCVRIGVAISELSIISNNRNETDGPAFPKALEGIETLKNRNSDHWLQISFYSDSSAQPIVESMLQLLSALTKSWTSKQRDIVWELEARHMQQNLVAKALGISKTVVHKQLRASKYEEYRQTWESFENYLLYMDDLNIEDKLMPIKKYPAYYNVALYRYDHGELEQAINILNRYLELAHEEIQAEDVFLVPIYNLLASVYNKAEDFDNASTAIQKSLYLQEKLPKARAQFVETIKIKAAVYAHENKLDEAIKTLNAALELSENIFDARDPFKISLKNDLASAYSKSGDFEEAISMYRNVVEIAEGNGCLVASAAAKLDISYCYQRQNRNSEAVILAQEALRIFEDWLPRNHKYIQIAYEYISLS